MLLLRETLCVQIISGFKAEVCYRTLLFVLITCNRQTKFWIWHRITGTNLYSLWPSFQKKGKPSLKAIDKWWSAYANIVISKLVRIMITFVRQTEKQKDCSADVTWPGSNWKTSFGWIYGHQYHVVSAKVLFFVLLKNYICNSFFSAIWFCNRIIIFNYFICAKHKATETFLNCLINKPSSKINYFNFFVFSHYLIAKDYRSNS